MTGDEAGIGIRWGLVCERIAEERARMDGYGFGSIGWVRIRFDRMGEDSVRSDG
ncbi:MAG: hypothetical protein ABEJ58_09265 [Halodesulfurarchaeum sp.]